MTTNSKCPVCRYFPLSESQGLKSRQVTLFVDWLTQGRLEFYADLNERLQDCRHPVKILDLSAFTFPQQSRSFIRSINLDVARGVSGVKRLTPKFLGGLPNIEFSNQLEDSVRSHLATKYNGSTNLLSRAIDTYILKMIASSLYSQLPELDSSESVWIFQNGRLPHQRAILSYCKLKGIKHLVLESNLFWESHYWARPYPPHDRQSLQEETVSRVSQVGVAERNLANSWFSELSIPNSETNKFTKRFAPPREKPALTERNPALKNAVVFTSSSDEFVGLGEYWPRTGWNGQYESFSHVSKILEGRGYSLTLRIHPNFQNKSLKTMLEDYSNLRRLVQECRITVIGPESSVNSYDLVESAEIVVVSSSTIGLEALHRHKKVIVTENSNYDLLPGVLKINPGTEQKEIEEFIDSPLIRGEPSAADWVALQMSLGWSAKERPGLMKKNSIFGQLKYLLNWTFLVDTATLLTSRLVEFLPRQVLLFKIRKLEEGQSRMPRKSFTPKRSRQND